MATAMTEQKMLKLTEAAEALRISKATLLRWIWAQRVGVVRLSARTLLVPASEVERLLDERFIPAFKVR